MLKFCEQKLQNFEWQAEKYRHRRDNHKLSTVYSIKIPFLNNVVAY
jgi:hypothetical protein